MRRAATISACGRYRYSLERDLGPDCPRRHRLTWLMLNPSTADANRDDPTIRKVIGFTRRAGYDAALVVNLYAWRATDPRDLRKNLAKAEGRRNLAAIVRAARASDGIVCAWGATPWARSQAARVLRRLTSHVEPARLLCLGTSKLGAPLHPLMLSYAQHGLRPFPLGSVCLRM